MSIRLEQALRTSETARWHTVPLARVQSVGEHVYNVTQIALYIAEIVAHLFPDQPLIDAAQLTLAASQHDIEEGITGDIPTPLKRATNIRNEIAGLMHARGFRGATSDPRITALLKMADMVDAIRTVHFYGLTPHAKRIERDLREALKDVAVVDFLWLGNHSHGVRVMERILARVFTEQPMEITDKFNVV